MAVTAIAHKPDLTVEQARAVFAKHFDGKYRIEDFKAPIQLPGFRRDFMVVKNGLVGLTVKLDQAPGETKFTYSGVAPSLWARFLATGLLSLLLWNGLTAEVRQFIETEPQFH